jgi:riboflavin biosynthesis pyrimidine reductase
MSIVATIVVGTDGSSTLRGSSTEVTSAADRATFLQRRRTVDCIIIGGNTARNEPYSKTPVPLVIVSRQAHPHLPKAHVWNLDPKDAVDKARKEFGENILIEGGASFISYLLDHNVVDVIELSVTPASGGADILDYKKYLSLADSVNKSVVSDTTFYTAEFKRLQ